MGNRLNLQKELESILGNRNVYFQPPENLKMSYPCIRYERTAKDATHADNDKYLIRDRYTITIITKDPDSKIPLSVYTHFRYCGWDRTYVVNNLYHDVLTLVY